MEGLMDPEEIDGLCNLSSTNISYILQHSHVSRTKSEIKYFIYIKKINTLQIWGD